MVKRSFIAVALLALLVISAGVVSAQAPFVSISSPGSGTVVNLSAVLPVSVSFGNAPEGGATLMVRAWNDTESVLFAQAQTIDVSIIPWNAALDFSATPPPAGSTGHLTAYMLDTGGTVIATSPPINVTYGSAPAPTATATATTPPLPTPTATATTPGGSPGITVTTPVAGATVDPSTNIPVSGTTSNLPAGATILVRLRNSNGETLGEQGIVPTDGQPWNLTVTKNVPNVQTTAAGDLFAFLILNGSVVAQTNAIPLNFVGAPPSPAVTITTPANGATLSRTSPNTVSGSYTNLPGGATVLVQAFVNGSGSPVGQQTASLNMGSWTASLSITTPVSAGSAGTLRAFAMNGNTVIASSNVVNVVYGTQSGSPFVQITVPSQNAIVAVNSAPIQIFGLAGNLPANSIVVRALDAFSNVLSQATVGTDGAGNWSALLNVSVAPGTPGSLYAFVTGSQGAIVASSRVNVFYGAQCFARTDWPVYVVSRGDTLLRIAQRVGSNVTELAIANCLNNVNLVYVGQQLRVPRLPVTPPPAQATLRIITPVQNATINTGERVTVTGAGRNLAGNDVVVRVLDANGNLLAQQSTRVGAAGGDGESQWQVSLSVLAQDGTRGSIYAFAQVPNTSTVLADALIDVNFSSDVVVVPTPPPGAEQRLIITQPGSDAALTPNGDIPVTGLVIGEFEGEVWVVALDNDGNQIAQVEANVAAAVNGQSSWDALLTLNVQPGTRGTIYAYVSAPFSNERGLADAVNVLFGQDNGGPYVTITDPMPHAFLDLSAPLIISGRGGRLFEGNVQVQALDDQGNVLADSFTTINSPDAGTGGEGSWQLSLPISVPAGTRGIITAFSTSAQDVSIVAYASVHVTYGDPTTQPNYVRINTPFNNAVVDPSQTVMIAGTADDSSASSVTLQILDTQGNVLVEQPRNLNPSVEGDFGVWQMLIELSSMAPGTELRINAINPAGTPQVSDSVTIIVGAPSA